jgi:hypothetical protein
LTYREFLNFKIGQLIELRLRFLIFSFFQKSGVFSRPILGQEIWIFGFGRGILDGHRLVYGEELTWGPDGRKYFDGKFEFLGYERYPKFNK